MSNPIILYDNRFADGALSATDTESGYDVNNIKDLRAHTFWKAASPGTKYITEAPLLKDTLAQEEMRISPADGYAGVYLPASLDLTPYIDDRIVCLDSALKKHIGYIKSVSTDKAVNLIDDAIAGMSIADDSDLDMGTNNFTAVRKVVLPDWSPSAQVVLLRKQVLASTDGWTFGVHTDGTLYVVLIRDSVATTYYSTAATGFTNGTKHTVGASITRETAAAAGSIVFVADGVQLGTTVAITAADTRSLSNSSSVYVSGGESICYASANYDAALYNRALSVAEHLVYHQTGVAAADKWGSQTAVYTSDFSAGADSWAEAAQTTVDGNIDGIGGEDNWLRGTLKNGVNVTHIARRTTPTLVTGKKYRITGKYFIPSTNSNCDGIRFVDSGGVVWWSAILNTLDAATTFTAEFTATTDVSGLRVYAYDGSAYQFTDAGGDDVYYIKDIVMVEIGATLALESEGIQRDAWKDSSTNGLNASYPASGYSFLRPIRTDSAEGLLSVTNVSLAADADTTLYTVPTGKRLVLTKAILVVGADAGTSVISIGADGAETDWLPNNTLSALDAANDAAILVPVPNTTPTLIKSYAAGTVIQAKVSSHAGGATNSLSLFGYLY